MPDTPASWVVTPPRGPAYETFSKRNADLARSFGWMVEPITDYLVRINAQAK